MVIMQFIISGIILLKYFDFRILSMQLFIIQFIISGINLPKYLDFINIMHAAELLVELFMT